MAGKGGAGRRCCPWARLAGARAAPLHNRCPKVLRRCRRGPKSSRCARKYSSPRPDVGRTRGARLGNEQWPLLGRLLVSSGAPKVHCRGFAGGQEGGRVLPSSCAIRDQSFPWLQALMDRGRWGWPGVMGGFSSRGCSRRWHGCEGGTEIAWDQPLCWKSLIDTENERSA